MGKLLSTLHSPQLVADFQRICGVSVLESEPLIDNGTGKPSNDFDISKLSDTVNVSKRKRKNGNKTDLENELQIGNSKSDLHSGSMKFKVTNRFLYHIFCFGSNLGNEIFYICFFPFWFWNVDGYVGRRLCFFWGLFMYLGQATKDMLKIPRPASPPVIRMEDRYALEYGMPSTHAMVGAGIPFGIFFLTKERYIFPSEVTLAVAILWCTLVCCSRCYLGMHSVLDVLAGLIYVFALMFVCFNWSLMDLVDHFVLEGGFLSFLLCLCVPLALCIFYPSPKNTWSTARGDTTIITAVCCGQLLSHWLSYQLGQMSSPVVASRVGGQFLGHNSTLGALDVSAESATSLPSGGGLVLNPPYPVTPLTAEWAMITLSRTVLGLVVLVACRFLIKTVSLGLVCKLNGHETDDSEARRSLRVELPYKFATYSLLTICALLLCPVLFRELGIERETYFTEL